MRYGNKGQGNGEMLEGRYANYFEIGHNAFEFLLDFGQSFAGEPDGWMHTRIVTSPIFARRLADSLNQALAQYERTHSRIPGEGEEPDGDVGADNIRHIHAHKTP
jgi:hypothetical protein